MLKRPRTRVKSSPAGTTGATPNSRYAPRTHQAAKILSILHDYIGPDLAGMRGLDIGCGTGVISQRLSHDLESVIGLEIDASSFQTGMHRDASSLSFVVGDGARIPVPDASFDVIICAQVYEHAADPSALAQEIWRVLRPGGVCFVSGPNRLAVMEEHYWLPFLSWLPGPLADLYMRLGKRGEWYDIKPLLYWQMRALWRSFLVQDYGVRLLQHPQQFNMSSKLGRFRWLSRLPRWFLALLLPFLPNYNWILVKHADT